MQASILFVGNHHNVILVTRHELLEELKKEGYDIIVSIPDNLLKELHDERIAFVRNSIFRFGTNPFSEKDILFYARHTLKNYTHTLFCRNPMHSHNQKTRLLYPKGLNHNQTQIVLLQFFLTLYDHKLLFFLFYLGRYIDVLGETVLQNLVNQSH